MNRRILLFLLLVGCHRSFAQYGGGDGQGHDKGNVIQVNLDGLPLGTFPLYQGGDGEGHSSLWTSSWLNGQPQKAIYGGGWGDGHVKAVATVAIEGTALTGLFSGGNGDGHVKAFSFSFLDGTPSIALYGGGNRDGHARAFAQSYFGVSSAALFSGGDGDGHDVEFIQAAIAGTNLSMLYGGGDGDGHDVEKFYQSAIPFPITLLSFEAFPMETFVLVQWVTEREENAAFFTVEKTKDGSFFLPVAEVPAVGNSELPTPYETLDPRPFKGRSYYRLKATDLDGAFSYSHLAEVNFAAPEGWNFVLYPNPNDGEKIMLDISGLKEGEVFTVQILDMEGKLIASGKEEEPAPGLFTYSLDLDRRLPAGSYLVRVESEQKGGAAKILLVR